MRRKNQQDESLYLSHKYELYLSHKYDVILLEESLLKDQNVEVDQKDDKEIGEILKRLMSFSIFLK
jgi:hypothetical protein